MPAAIEPLTAEEEAALRAAWVKIGAWEATDRGEYWPCPLCGGEGETDGFRMDAVNVTPATLGGYGIGDGLRAAELVAESTGPLLATLDASRAALESVTRERDARLTDEEAVLVATKHRVDWMDCAACRTSGPPHSVADLIAEVRKARGG